MMKITKSKLKRIIKEELLKEYAGGDSTEPKLGGTETGLPGSGWTSNPGLDNIVDITKSALEMNPQAELLQIADALRNNPSRWKADLMRGVLVVDGKYVIGKPEKFEIASDDEFVEVGEYVIGMLG